MASETKKTILELVGFLIYITIVLAAIPYATGFFLGGFEREFSLQLLWTYSAPGIIFAIGLIAFVVYGLIAGDKEYSYGIIHAPEKNPSIFSFFKKVPKIIMNPILLAWISILFFGMLFLFAIQTQTFFSEIPRLEQQFTVAADTLFSMYPPAPAETVGAGFIMALGLFLLHYLRKKLNFGKIIFFFLSIFTLTAFSGAYGAVLHVLRYSGSDIAMAKVIMFWSFGGLITALFGSLIPFLMMHDVNNLFVKLSELFTSDVVFKITVSIGIVIVFLFIFMLIVTKRIKNEKKNNYI